MSPTAKPCLAIRRALLVLLGCCWLFAATASEPLAQAAPKVVRYSFLSAETGFDPAQVSDLYSAIVIAHIFETPLTYDYVERPVRVKPQTAEALPEHSADFREWTLRIRPGIYFADDPAFEGHRRELTAADYAYTLKRHFDPRWKSPSYNEFSEDQILGLEALRQKALDQRQPFDYDAPVPGLQLEGRYTLRIRLGRPGPQFMLKMANPLFFGASAREVVERYGSEVMAHPVGTGPFKLVQWRRSSLIVLERNPQFREQFYDSHPAPEDTVGVALARQFNGRRLPMIDRLEFAIIEASQPTWLSFLAKDFELVLVPPEFTSAVAPGGKLALRFAREGMQLEKVLRADHTYTYFNMDDPVIGGYTPDRIALRRAFSLAYSNADEITRVRQGLGLPAQSMLVPHTQGYDPEQNFGFSEYSPAKAKALLDLYGYVDKDGDGWRDLPDGKPLVLQYYTQGSDFSRQLNELWRKDLAAIGIQVKFVQGQWPDQFKMAKAGKLQIWGLGNTATSPDASIFLKEAHGPMIGAENLCRFNLPAYNDLVAKIDTLPDGEERRSLMARAQALLAVYMPIKPHVHRYRLMLSQPWFLGYRDHPFARDFGRFVDVEAARQPVIQSH